jgi:hypothetical protein
MHHGIGVLWPWHAGCSVDLVRIGTRKWRPGMRRTVTTGLFFGVLAISAVAHAQGTAEEDNAAAAELFARAHEIEPGFTPGWGVRAPS